MTANIIMLFVPVYVLVGGLLWAILDREESAIAWVSAWPVYLFVGIYTIVQTWTCTQKGHKPGPAGYCTRCGAITEVDYRW